MKHILFLAVALLAGCANTPQGCYTVKGAAITGTVGGVAVPSVSASGPGS